MTLYILPSVGEIYTDFYTRNKNDSPDESRFALARKLDKYAAWFSKEDLVLDMGAGRQALERDYLSSRNPKPEFKIVTLDIARVTNGQLLARNYPQVRHVIQDGSSMEFDNDTFSLLVSNLALDFMPRTALKEAYRVLKPGRHALVNLHHPELIPEDLDEEIKRREILGYRHGRIYNKRMRTLQFWKYLRDNQILFTSPAEINQAFSSAGFGVECVKEASDREDKWWEVDLIKPVQNIV